MNLIFQYEMLICLNKVWYFNYGQPEIDCGCYCSEFQHVNLKI